MLSRMMRHIRREPLPALAVFLFAAILAGALCFLRQTQIRELEDYEKAYASVPVYFSVVDLDGTSPDDTIVGWAANLFYEWSNLEPSFSEFVKDVVLKMEYPSSAQDEGEENKVKAGGRLIYVIGVSSLYLVPELTEDYGGSITWVDGYDESVLASKEWVCLVPEGFTDASELQMLFSYKDSTMLDGEVYYTEEKLTIVGYTTSRSDKEYIYCPYDTLAKILSKIHAPYNLIGIGATMNDNNRLDELQVVADYWFARPNQTGKETPWGHYGYEYYPYALRIDDGLLKNLDATMKQSMTINRLSALAIFCIAAGAGFLIGFLIIRARKREINLMRTLGSSTRAIYGELAGEQMLCVAVGTVLGGSYALWRPVGQLGLFVGIYFLGLSAALLIFLRLNLLTTMKEDE